LPFALQPFIGAGRKKDSSLFPSLLSVPHLYLPQLTIDDSRPDKQILRNPFDYEIALIHKEMNA